MRPVLMLLALIAPLASPALAQEPQAYVDDRSTPQAVVQSYYNAINRAEYVRAYSYFGEGKAPDYDSWEAGYADTASVELVVGTATSEGAAGSVYYSLPVAIEASSTGGVEKHVFAGCYTLRLANPAIQGVPFRPTHIEEAHLEPATGALPEVLPKDCSN